MRFLAERAGPEAVGEFARRQIADLENRYREAVGSGSPSERVRALGEALSADGYAASASGAAGGGEQLCQHHCPVAHVAAEYPQLCEAETEAFGRLLGTPVQRLATIAHGDGVCTTHVTPPSLLRSRGTAGPSAASPAAAGRTAGQHTAVGYRTTTDLTSTDQPTADRTPTDQPGGISA